MIPGDLGKFIDAYRAKSRHNHYRSTANVIATEFVCDVSKITKKL